MGEALRLFIALELNPAVQSALETPLQTLQSIPGSKAVRWTPLKNIHLTLKFLGDTPDTQVDEIQAAIESAGEDISALDLTIQGVGVFPNPKRPRVVWLGLEDHSKQLKRLQRNIEQRMEPLGFAPEQRSFSPHLTVGRVKKNADMPAVAKLGEAVAQIDAGINIGWPCEAISLVKSDLLPSGPIYTSLYHYQLDRGQTNG
ncbi:MAG: RNA 2',3'-cyclic phosphodiesterase [Chloroflexi bacterium]|nr:RNA 2',3'-cyclic phosphodiesterase [Chloroflexota bacterium]